MTKIETWKRLVELGIVDGDIPSERWNLNKANLRGADLFEANLRFADLIDADLGGAKLIGADFVQANLHGANLSNADLRGANLRVCNLSGADLSGVHLFRADLSGSILTGVNFSNADLTEAALVNADLTGAILSGACIDNANLTGWIIKEVVCTHIIHYDGPSQKLMKYSFEEFEKKYTHVHTLSELILKIPLTESSSFIGKFISQSINYLHRSNVIDLKGVEAIADNDTKFIFNIFDNDFFDNKKELIETTLRDALNKYFMENPMASITNNPYDPIEDQTNGIISTRDYIPIPYTHYQINPKSVRSKIIEYYIKLGQMGEAIHTIIASVFK